MTEREREGKGRGREMEITLGLSDLTKVSEMISIGGSEVVFTAISSHYMLLYIVTNYLST